MSKNRHIKTHFEKYGIVDISEEFNQSYKFNKSNKHNDIIIYRNIPYIGIMYIPINYNFRNLLNDFEDGTIIKNDVEYMRCKIISSSETHLKYFYWDDHHHEISIINRDFSDYMIQGNEVILKHT